MTDEPPYYLFEWLNLVATIPSIVGTLLMGYFCSRNMKDNTLIKFLFSLAISDLVYSLSNLMSAFDSINGDGDAICVVEGVTRDFSSKFSIWIATSIALFHCKVTKVRPDFNQKRFLTVSLAVGGLVSLTSASR